MKIHQLIQGSPEWHAHRRAYFNASDAPAMMGCCPHKTRNQLIKELATGIPTEVDEATQRRFAEGHRAEALARPLAEQIIGAELYPVTGTQGRLSASFDGLTMLEDTAWEHKLLNNSIRQNLPDDDDGDGRDLPLHYQAQMEQQCMVSGCSRVLFLATRWDDAGNLLEKRVAWYEPNPELADAIRRGWEQLAADVAAYVPAEPATPVVAAPMEHLPAVSVQVSGALAVASNLDAFGQALRAFVARMPAKPSTDQEFADTDAACKRLKEAEERLQAAEDSALASMADVNEMRRAVAELRDLARTTRLSAEKLVKARKEQIREEEVRRGQQALAAHIAALNTRLGRPYMPTIHAPFAGAIKGLKTLDSVRNAIDTELSRAKIEASALADLIEVNMRALAAAGDSALFPDAGSLVLKAPEDLQAVVAQRVADAQRRLDEQRERIRAEEAARMAREQAEREATQQRAPAVAPPAAPPAAPAAPAVVPINPPASPNGATIKLGEVSARLGFTVTADFLASLGFQARTEKAAKLYRADDWPAMCDAIAAHVHHVRDLRAAA